MDFCEKEQKQSEELGASHVSRLLYLWILPFLRRGYSNDLEVEDVYKVLPGQSSSLHGRLFLEIWEQERKLARMQNRPPKLWNLVISSIGRKYILVGLGHFFDEMVLRIIQPLLLQDLIRSFQENSQTFNFVHSSPWVYAVALVLITGVHGVILQLLIDASIRSGSELRLGFSSLIYRKILTLGKSDSENANVGKLVNLLSNDVRSFDHGLILLHILWISPIQLLIFTYLLWREIGIATFGALGCICFIFPLQVLVGRASLYFRTRIAKRTDSRGRVLNEIISGIRVIKMYAWEKPLGKLISKLRREEVKFIRQHLFLRGMFVCLNSAAAKLIPFSALILYVSLGNTLTADKTFFAISIFRLILQAVISRIPNCTSTLGELFASLNRIEGFLLSDDSSKSISFHQSDSLEGAHDHASIIMSSYCAGWTESSWILNGLNVNIKGNQLVMVVGEVGSGKASVISNLTTSFLNGILSELPILRGTLDRHGSLAYSSQEAWIFPGTVRQNILCGLEMDHDRYWNIIKLCSLVEDLSQFPHGDKSFVGEKGICLSGGQKARVNLARAVYQEADIYLLDDPLSAVDAHVANVLFHDCIRSHLKGKLRILVTHHFHYLPLADYIIVLTREGKIWGQGSFDELEKSGIDLFTLLQDQKDTKEENVVSDLENHEKRKEVELEEMSIDEKSKMLKSHASDVEPSKIMKEEKKNAGSVGFSTYLRYFQLGDSTITLIILVITFLVTQILFDFIEYWLSLWTNTTAGGENQSERKSNEDRDFYSHVYCSLIAAFILTTVTRSILFFKYCMQISVNLHDSMFSSVSHTKVNFFDNNPAGRIMNRFTRDVNQIDEQLPVAFYDFCNFILALFGMLAINVAANYYAIIPSIFVLFCLWKLRQFYLATSRDLKRIEAITKSSLFTLVTQTSQGLTTIRALKAENRFFHQFQKIQDTDMSIFHMINKTNRWFGVWLEILSTAFLAVVCFCFIIATSVKSGNVGVAVSTTIAMTLALQWGIRQSAETENHMTSVERVLEYCHLEPETGYQSDKCIVETVKECWPNLGQIEFRLVSLAYDNLKDNKVLKEISFKVNAREKVGIVGRTGAGKSSILTALFRLTDITSGRIIIDGVNIGNVSLETLRSRIGIIPQDPVLIKGSIRFNLDPFQEYSDEKLWQVLKTVNLQNVVHSLEQEVADGGGNFSTGQKQLVCFARAILRENKIICLDEATANVDPKTDELIQETLRIKFSNCTILTIAHRLSTIMDYDKIMVLDAGKIVEFDRPDVLLVDSESILFKMFKVNSEGS